jgi:hypothetical protein
VLASITGSPLFPGGLGTYTVSSLTFEQGPSAPVQLQWATYYDAADQAGLSRIWGGIHPPVDDFAGRRAGAECGQLAWALARRYWDGSVGETPSALSIRQLHSTDCELRYSAIPGLYYTIQSSTDLNQPFLDEAGTPARATHTSETRTNSFSGPSRFFRVRSSIIPAQ